MAEGDATIYNVFKYGLLNGAFDLANDTIKVILVSGYTPDIDNHAGYADVIGDEYATADGYTAGGETLSNQATSQDDANDLGKFDADDVTWSSLGPLSPNTPSHAILCDMSSAGSAVMICFELGTTATSGGDYTLQWNADGILTDS